MLQIDSTQGEGNKTPEMKLKSENWDRSYFRYIKAPHRTSPLLKFVKIMLKT